MSEGADGTAEAILGDLTETERAILRLAGDLAGLVYTAAQDRKAQPHPLTEDDWAGNRMTARGWAAINQACFDLLRLVEAHRDEIAEVMRAHGSHYRPGSFVAALNDLMNIAFDEHQRQHASEGSVE